MNFALYFGNRGFFPGELVASARNEMIEAVLNAGYGYIVMDESKTHYGAIEGIDEGRKYAEFLEENRGKFDGVIMCLPNFSDENGAVEALAEANVPILIQAYPDEVGKMSFEERRDAFCGKFSIMDMFTQYNIPFSCYQPHVCTPNSVEFAKQLEKFGACCRVVKGMKKFKIGAIGARTTKFKTVRFDELALQKYGITVDTLDLSELFDKVAKFDDEKRLSDRMEVFANYSDFSNVPKDKAEKICKVSLIVEDYVKTYHFDALALRCWDEFPQILNISVCVVVSFLNNIGIPCACEMDVCNAVAMRMLSLASQTPATCLDWNNNYGKEANKCILFHCGPVPKDMMVDKGEVTDHKMFAKTYGKGNAFGTMEGRITPSQFTYASCKTENGKMQMYMGRAKFTDDTIEKAFFGCGGVAEFEDMEKVLEYVGRNGYRHHVSVTNAEVLDAVFDASVNYLHYDVENLSK